MDESPIAQYIDMLKRSETFASQIAHHRLLPAREAVTQPTARPLSRAVAGILEHRGIGALYSHQARAIDAVRAGRHVAVATPTASGKSLIYNLPLMESFLANPDSRAIYLFPLKALAQDQLGSFRALTEHWPEDARPTGAIYDGDTTPWARKKVRDNPPTALFTNPEMLHLSLLPHNETWSALFASLEYVVVDEAHTYRGLLGSHMAQVFRRLLRVCGRYGSQPRFIFSSATIGNPGQLATDLTGLSAEVVRENGAPCGRRHMVFLDPLLSPSSTAIQLLQEALERGLRTIVYTPSRRMAELISLWAAEKSGKYRDRISAYRAGFLPEERREIEARMSSGELLAVISTSALELGIDIGALDLCILVGYPGTVTSFMQRGGRVGRACRDSAVIFVAGEDALDRHFIRNPDDFFARGPEDAVLNPFNPVILGRHLPCAAAEIPLDAGEAWLGDSEVGRVARALEAGGALLRSADGTKLFARQKNPQRDIDLRSAGPRFAIQTAEGAVIGSIDGWRAWKETHPGAVYLHRGRSYVVERLDMGARTAVVAPGRPDYYTRVRGSKETEILEIFDARMVGQTIVRLGRLRVTEHISGYEKRGVRDGRLRGVTPLDAPPQVFETVGLWFDVPEEARLKIERMYLHFMGSIHALEHAAIGVLPLLVMTDRNDFGGISIPMHPQTGTPAVFIYDALPGGAGLAAAAFSRADELLEAVHRVIRDCPCEAGCPSCVHSPKCGSGNRPIDKAGALYLLETLLEDRDRPFDREEACRMPDRSLPTAASVGKNATENVEKSEAELQAEKAALAAQEEKNIFGHSPVLRSLPTPRASAGKSVTEKAGMSGQEVAEEWAAALAAQEDFRKPDARRKFQWPAWLTGAQTSSGQEENAPFSENYVVFDVETQRSAAEVGGWGNARRMGLSVGVVYDARADAFVTYTEEEAGQMIERLAAASLVIGFNSRRFDYAVLSAYTPLPLAGLPTLDLLEDIRSRLSYRVSLDNLARATLGAAKTADGLAALRWWKEGRVDEIARYCREDVRLTRDLYRFGRENGYVLFTNKAGCSVRAPVFWGDADLAARVARRGEGSSEPRVS